MSGLVSRANLPSSPENFVTYDVFKDPRDPFEHRVIEWRESNKVLRQTFPSPESLLDAYQSINPGRPFRLGDPFILTHFEPARWEEQIRGIHAYTNGTPGIADSRINTPFREFDRSIYTVTNDPRVLTQLGITALSTLIDPPQLKRSGF